LGQVQKGDRRKRSGKEKEGEKWDVQKPIMGTRKNKLKQRRKDGKGRQGGGGGVRCSQCYTSWENGCHQTVI